jgi:hypothetical protein
VPLKILLIENSNTARYVAAKNGKVISEIKFLT